MHTSKYSRKPLALAICLFVTLALTGVTAWADEWGSGPKTVTVSATKEFEKDLASDGGTSKSANVVVDIYKIGNATRNSEYVTYEYSLIEPFASNGELASKFASGDWAAVAEDALEVVKSSSVSPTATAGLDAQIDLSSAADEGDGVYLVLPHGADQESTSLKASSADYDYTFIPSIVALPTKDDVDQNEAIDSGVGEWIPDAKIYLKASREKPPTTPEKPNKPNKPTTPTTPTTPSKTVRTGDDTNLSPLYTAMVVSGVGFALLAAYGIRDRRRARAGK